MNQVAPSTTDTDIEVPVRTHTEPARDDEDDSFKIRLPSNGIPLKEIERQALIAALKKTNWVQLHAARLLDISPRVMNFKIKAHGIVIPKRDLRERG